MRHHWHRFWMEQAQAYAERATCDRKHVGCVLVRDNRLISAGYNGALPKLPHCDEVGHLFLEGRAGCQRINHAEANAVAQAARIGHVTEGCIAYVTVMPCLNCLKLLIMAGIRQVFYLEPYREDFAADLAKQTGVELLWIAEPGNSFME